MKKLYTHDCPECFFLGVDSKKKIDLYFCTKESVPVTRRSSNGSDYSSGFIHKEEIKEAIKKAIKIKLIRGK